MNKQITKRLFATALAIVLMLGMLPFSVRAAFYRDGTYTGVGKGYDGDIKLSVTVQNGGIAAIETVYQKETKVFWEKAKTMLDSIVAANSAEVDAVSGATHSCEGIREAVKSALASASAEDAAPVFQSSKNYGGEKTDALHGVAFTKDGGFVAMGYSFGDSDSPEWKHVGNANYNDAILMKFNAVHELEWAKAYATDGVDVFESIDVLNDGRIVALGRQSFNSEDKTIKGVSWYLLVIDPNDPDVYTDYRIGGTAGDQGYGVAATSDGGFVAAGWSASKSGYLTSSTDRVNYAPLTQLWEPQDGTNDEIPNRVASSGSDSIVVKFDKDGNLQYTALHNYSVSENANNISSPSERLEDIAVDSQDNIYLVGYDAIAKNAQNAVIAKLNGADGSLLWHRSAGREAQSVVPTDAAEYIKAEYSGIVVLTDDSVAVTGTSTADADTDENWQVTGVKDTLAVHYSADGELVHATSFGTINDNDSRPEAILATPDGGYIIASNQSGMMHEDDRLAEGYDWGSYGGEDAVLLKYDAEDQLVWTENYGTTAGDWINALALRDGELIAVGESNGSGGCPAWNNNGGGVDGIILCTGLYSAAYTEPVLTADDGDVVWADGTYTDEGTGHAGTGSVTVTVEITDGAITSVTGTNRKDTATYYDSASVLHSAIKEAQSAEVDAVSGATHSSEGIKEAARKALSRSAAAHVDALIEEITDEETARAAASAFAELGSYAIGCLTKRDALEAAAEQYGVALVSRVPQPITEEQPVRATGLAYNDTYYKLQQQSFALIGAEAFKRSGLSGVGIKIAVLDSGVTGRHGDLDYSRILDGYNYDDDKEMPAGALIDNNGHGTAVTGILAAKTGNALGVAGLLDRVEIIPLKISPKAPDKDTDGASSKLVARAIREAVDVYGADVITTSMDVKETEELNEAVAYAVSKNVIITAASGNAGTADSTEDAYVYPAACEGVIGVGAVEANGVVRTSSTKNDKVFVTAPGGDIVLLGLSLSGRCKIADGTSYASPVVAAMAAAAKQRNKDMTVDEFKELLRQTAVDAGETGYDNAYGYGIVSLSALANKLMPRSSGGSSSSSVTVPVTSDTASGSILVKASVSGTTVTVAKLTDAQLAQVTESNAAAGAETTNTVSIDVGGVAKDIKTVVIPIETVKAVKESGSSLQVTLTDGSVVFDAAAQSAIIDAAKSTDIRLNLDVVSESSLNDAQRNTVQEMEVQKVVDVCITSNGTRISDFKGGVATLSVPCTLKDGQDGKGLVVWYVADDGTHAQVPSSYDGKNVVFSVTHFSHYVIAYDEELAKGCPKDASCPIDKFTDANAAEWYHDGVHWALENGVMNGVGDRKFAPADTTTRAQVTTMLWRLEGSPAYVGMSEFSDVDNEQWYGPAIRWASAEGIVNGYEDGRFGPNDPVTREQLAAILYRYAQHKKMDVSVGEDTNILSYDDAFSVSGWAMSAMQWACGSGIVNGIDKDGKLLLAPSDASTRAVVATMLWRFCK
ncbi:MAG: S8 family serine peptidase [Oscillospiraceae bacterium]|nr:S8 family serine peptidase [Oscillospiraceae bacterium]